MKRYTNSEFAKKIRSKYPLSYDDLSDERLIELWLKKYPGDSKYLNLLIKKNKNSKPTTLNKESHKNQNLINQVFNYFLRGVSLFAIGAFLATIISLIIDYDLTAAKVFGRESEKYLVLYRHNLFYEVVEKEPGYRYEYLGGKLYRFKIYGKPNASENFIVDSTETSFKDKNYTNTDTPINNQSKSNNSVISNNNTDNSYTQNNFNAISEKSEKQENSENWINILKGGINLLNELSKNDDFVRQTLPMICVKCNKTIEVDGYFKESTDEFKPIQDLPTEILHTHKWKLLR